jgi:hypothetical protein
MYALLICLLTLQNPTPLPERPVASIEGPTSAITGDLVVLKGSDSVGKGSKWITPSGIQTLQCSTCDFVPSLAFATGTPGKYKFILVVSMNDDITYVDHEVEITTARAPEPPPTPPPTSPEKGLAELSKQLSISRNDPATRSALASAIENQLSYIKQLCKESKCPTTDAAKSMVTKTIDSVLLARTGSSRNVPWDQWRGPLYEKINSYQYTKLDLYLNDVEEILKGLK